MKEQIRTDDSLKLVKTTQAVGIDILSNSIAIKMQKCAALCLINAHENFKTKRPFQQPWEPYPQQQST